MNHHAIVTVSLCGFGVLCKACDRALGDYPTRRKAQAEAARHNKVTWTALPVWQALPKH